MAAANDIGGIIVLAGVGVVGYFLITGLNTQNGIPKYNPPPSARGSTRAITAHSQVPVSGIAAAAGTMIYRGTGRIIPGSRWTNQSQQCWALASGGCRSSSRFQCEKGCCVNYRNVEATAYFRAGPISRNTKGSGRAMLSILGPGQSGTNCCVYSLGFEQPTGRSYAEEEGPHSPHPTIYAMPVQGDTVGSVGPIANRSMGIKAIGWYDGNGVNVEGWVDSSANGQWRRFYKSLNPHGGSLPVITRQPMAGSSCIEARFRLDNVWPVNFDTSRTFVAELATPIQPAR